MRIVYLRFVVIEVVSTPNCRRKKTMKAYIDFFNNLRFIIPLLKDAVYVPRQFMEGKLKINVLSGRFQGIMSS